jgi:hypothetical protein
LLIASSLPCDHTKGMWFWLILGACLVLSLWWASCAKASLPDDDCPWP